MKKRLVILGTLALIACFVVVGNVYAQFGNKVSDTPHNMREATVSGMTLTDYGEICVYCHTPHNNNIDIEVPLWNRSTPAAGQYQMYDSPSLDMDIATSPVGVSLACLSCHDNSIALDQIINRPSATANLNASGIGIQTCATQCHVGSNPVDGLNFEGTFLDTDLRNDHPISVEFDPSKDPKFHAMVDNEINGMPLYGTNHRVECASCHNPHDNSNRPFLRISNENSAMCLACHDI